MEEAGAASLLQMRQSCLLYLTELTLQIHWKWWDSQDAIKGIKKPTSVMTGNNVYAIKIPLG